MKRSGFVEELKVDQIYTRFIKDIYF